MAASFVAFGCGEPESDPSYRAIAFGVATEASGHVYVAGIQQDNRNSGDFNLLVVRYEPGGVQQWTQTARRQRARGVATDAAGHAYVVGSGSRGLLVVKYDPSGALHWTRELPWKLQLGTTAAGTAVATDAAGNIYVAGGTDAVLDGNRNAGGYDLFVAKYDPSGNQQWVRQHGTAQHDDAHGVATDAAGNVYVAGETEGGLDGNINAGSADFFVVKYDASGTRLWTRQLGTPSPDQANGAATDAMGNVYVAGTTGGGLNGNRHAGGEDLFVVKYDPSGAQQWTRQLGTPSPERANGVATDATGNVCVAGATEGGLDGNTNAGSADLLLVKFEPGGALIWTRQLGTPNLDQAHSVAVDSAGNVYAAGRTDGQLRGNRDGNSKGLALVKFSPDGQLQSGE